MPRLHSNGSVVGRVSSPRDPIRSARVRRNGKRRRGGRPCERLDQPGSCGRVLRVRDLCSDRSAPRRCLLQRNRCLHAAAAACGIGHGSRVATSSLSFVASANCARYVGADVEFVDIDPNTLNMALEDVSPATDALVAVHYAGLPVDWQRLAVRPAVVIEDAAHALGAATPDGPVGNCARSDVCVFSPPPGQVDHQRRGRCRDHQLR